MISTKTEAVKLFLQAARECDWDKLETYCHEEFQVRESEALPFAGIYKGVDGFRKLARLIFIDSFSEFNVVPKYFTEDESHVLLIADISGIGKKSGIQFVSELVEIYHFEQDLIKEIQPYYWDGDLINDVVQGSRS